MKKYTIVLCIAMALAMAQTAFSQDLILRFTGAKTDGSYVRMDSLTVQNINRSWTETAVYPDTVLIFKLSGISTAQDIAADIVAYPNPFSGATNVAVTMPQSGDATMQVFNLAGQKVMERAMKLESGENLFEVHLQEPQTYLLTITTAQGCRTIKLLNCNAGGGNSLSFRGTGDVQEKRQSAQMFYSGDVIKIVGYASTNSSVVASREIRQAQTASANFTLLFSSNDSLTEFFSVSSIKRVRFSKGNLQWSATGTHATLDSTAPGTWRFAPNPWDIIGSANSNISSTYTGWIDLFGWGTSGWSSGAVAYQPYSTNTSDGNYYPGSSAIHDLSGTYAKADWGVYNAISNGGNQPGMWRTLSQPEWDTLLNIRTTLSGIRYAKATVNGVAGLIIVPDNWASSTYNLDSTNIPGASYSANIVTTAQWSVLENANCVFLPVAGYRSSRSVYLTSTNGDYWTSTHYDNYLSFAYFMNITTGNVNAYANQGRNFGRSVRLVQDVP